jgi:hypothetical protein
MEFYITVFFGVALRAFASNQTLKKNYCYEAKDDCNSDLTFIRL